MEEHMKWDYWQDIEKFLYVHRGVSFHARLMPSGCWGDIEAFQSRPSDICVASLPRSGTHWMLHIINLILGIEDAEVLSLPVFEGVLISAVVNSDAPRRMGYQVIDELPTDRPRVYYTHLPATHLPKSLWNKDGVKIIHMVRNPYDSLKSAYKLNASFLSNMPSFSTFLKRTFDPKVAHLGTWTYTVKSYWEKRHRENVHCVCYEDLKKSFRPTVASVAQFLGHHLSEEELDRVQKNSTLESMRALQAARPPNQGTAIQNVVDTGLSNKAILEYSDEDVALVQSQLQELADVTYLKDIC